MDKFELVLNARYAIASLGVELTFGYIAIVDGKEVTRYVKKLLPMDAQAGDVVNTMQIMIGQINQELK